MADVRDRVASIVELIPRPPVDVGPMRDAFTSMVSEQWQQHVPGALRECEAALPVKARFIGQMYARACYSVLLVSAGAPRTVRLPILAGSRLLSQSRAVTIRVGWLLLRLLPSMLPDPFHRQLLLMSAVMGMLDVVLDRVAVSGEAAALHVASLLAEHGAEDLAPEDRAIVVAARAARQRESAWQSAYWDQRLLPAVKRYCLAEVRGVEGTPDPTGMGHRAAGIEAVLTGMWYVIGPQIGLAGAPRVFEKEHWNREQQWMADTTTLMQMIDDWVDQDEDRDTRLTPVVSGDWTLETVSRLFDKTLRDLDQLLETNGIRHPVLKAILAELYRDYLHVALGAMDSGTAA